MTDSVQLLSKIRQWALELGFSQIGVAGVDLRSAEPALQDWLARGFHGDMQYMAQHGMRRARPAELVPGTVSVITARMDYLPQTTPAHWQSTELDRLQRPGEAVVSVYARGRDYHKVLRSRLQKLADQIAAELQIAKPTVPAAAPKSHAAPAVRAAPTGQAETANADETANPPDSAPFAYRVFTDSAPVLEAELASRSGIGWRGKHTLVLSRDAGSMFFLGEIYVNFALPETPASQPHCGSCSQCIDVCPTQAILQPGLLDARRCISYLTIEHAGPIPLELRPLIGNRIYGCDDCQLVCPWNKFAQRSALPDFDERSGLTGQQLVTLFAWTEAEFLQHTLGSPIRRIGHGRWQRNIAVAMGNALHVMAADSATVAAQQEIRAALGAALERAGMSPLLQEHVVWALEQWPPQDR